MNNSARGYISSGHFLGNRVPQHIQNFVIRSYCEANQLRYILSRAEYSFHKSVYSQLQAALEDNCSNIVFYSVWQLPETRNEREKIISEAREKELILHFACEDLKINDVVSSIDINNLFEARTIGERAKQTWLA